MDRTKDPTGSENVLKVVRYVDKDKVKQRLLSMQTTDKCDALSLTHVVLDELSNAGLDPNKILSQCHDGPSQYNAASRRNGSNHCVADLRSGAVFLKLWAADSGDADDVPGPAPPKRQRQATWATRLRGE